MKRAKIALTAIALFAVAGGALALKVRQPHLFYMNNAQNQCLVSTLLQSTTAPEGQGTVTSLSTASTVAPCPTIRITQAP